MYFFPLIKFVVMYIKPYLNISLFPERDHYEVFIKRRFSYEFLC